MTGLLCFLYFVYDQRRSLMTVFVTSVLLRRESATRRMISASAASPMRSIVFVSMPVTTSSELVDVRLDDSTEVEVLAPPPVEPDVPVSCANTFEAPARKRRMRLKNA